MELLQQVATWVVDDVVVEVVAGMAMVNVQLIYQEQNHVKVI